MSLTQLFFNEETKIADITIDAIISESASSKATLTKNPVEKGADTTDHIRLEPMSFSATGIVSDTPVKLLGNAVNIFKNSGYRISQQTWDKLLLLQAKREPFTLVQGLRSYDNIVIEELNYTQDVNTNNVLIFNCKMIEIVLVGQNEVNSQTITEQDTYDRTSPLINLGRKVFT